MNPLDPFPEPMEDATAILALHDKNYDSVALGFMREAVKYSRTCCRGKMDDGELISICYPALQQAAKNFKPKYGLKFFSFAKQYLRGAIAREWKRRDLVKNASQHEVEGAPFIPAPWTPTVKDNWSGEEIEGFKAPISIAVTQPDFESLDLRERWDLVWPTIQARLNEVERMVVVLRYKAGFSFQEIASLRGVTRQAIQRTHAQSLKKLSCALRHRKSLL